MSKRIYMGTLQGRPSGPTLKDNRKSRRGRPLRMGFDYIRLPTGMIVREDTFRRWILEAAR